MSEERVDRFTKFLKFLRVFLIVILFCSIFYFKIINLALMSTSNGCGFVTIEELNSKGYFLKGTFTFNSPNESENGIEINLPPRENKSKEYMKILRHEECHETQLNEGRLSSCSELNYLGYPYNRFVNEMEAYLDGYFDFIC